MLDGRGPTAAPDVPAHFERPSIAPGGAPSPSPTVAALAPPVIDPTMLNVMGLMGRETEVVGGG